MTTGIRSIRLFFVAALVLTAAGCRGEDGARVSQPTRDVTVLLDAGYAGTWPTGLDPATNVTGRANLSMMNAIYGGLFQLTADPDGTNAAVTGVLAAGYEIADEGRELVIHLREGVVFSDGTPFNAEAVRFNIERNLESPCTCAPTGWPWVKNEPVTTSGQHTVELHFTRPYGAVINAFPVSNINWIASPTALDRIGEEQFAITPVGAGPFRVVSNQLSSRLVLERNPSYWQDGHPYLDGLVFQSIGSEQAAFQALLAGDAQAVEGVTSTPLIVLALSESRVSVTQQPATSVYVVQLNTSVAPFDDLRAREAIYYATDVSAIGQGLFNNWYSVSQSFTGPGGLFHQAAIPGYRQYDLDRARSLVNDVGDIEVTLGTVRSFVAEQIVTALQTQWREAGIRVTIETYELAGMIQEFRSGEWQAMLQAVGSYDPESTGGVSFRFRSDQTYTGVRDHHLDGILIAAGGTFDREARQQLYFDAAKHISDHAYAPFLFAFAPTQLAVEGLQGPGLTTKIPPIFVNTGILWQDVRFVAD